MIQSVPNIQTEVAPNEPAKRETAREGFAQALELQTSAMLNAALDPGITASLPGAGTALIEADGARQDVSQLAARRLTEQQARQGTRERGQDAASQARGELAERPGTQPTSASDAENPEAVQEAEPSRFERQTVASDGPEPTETRARSSVNSEDRPQSAFTSTRATGSDTQSASVQVSTDAQALSQASASAGVSGRAIAASTGGAVPGVSSGLASVQGAPGAGAKAEFPGAVPGQASSAQKAGTERGRGRVYRQESRDFEAQLQRGLAQVLRQRGGTLSLKLDPAELGTVKVSLRLAQGRVEGTIEAATERARGLLNEHLDSLKGSLELRGITVDRLEVRLAGAGESERQFTAGQEAGRGLDQHWTGAGSGRDSSGGLGGGERQPGERGWSPGATDRDEQLRGAESEYTDESHAHGRAGEPHGGWLRLDTLA